MSAKSNHIVYKTLKFLYENFIVILPLLVGINLLLQYVNSNELTVYLYESEEVKGNYQSKFEIYNEGDPISKYELIQPLIVNLKDDNSIIDFDLLAKEPSAIKVWFSKLKKNKLKVDFDLLNESENISFSVLTKKPIHEFTISSRIKNIKDVVTYHYKIKPKFYDRIGKFWLLLLLFSVITFFDAMLLTSKNKQLRKVFTVINKLNTGTEKSVFSNNYVLEFEKYTVRFKRNTETVLLEVCELYDEITSDNIEEVKRKMKQVTKRSVLYSLRRPYLLISPILFIVSLIAIITSIVYYSTF